MGALVIGERRREPRTAPGTYVGRTPEVPGTRVLEVIDTSAHGLRCRLGGPVRPGRAMSVRVPRRGLASLVPARVVRCEVIRVTRHGLQYEAAWALERSWAHE